MLATKSQLIQTLKAMLAPHEKALKDFDKGGVPILPEEISHLCKTINAIETYQQAINKIQEKE
jgi:hypothetical protein